MNGMSTKNHRSSMGHYDSCYEADYEKDRQRLEKEREEKRQSEKRRIEDRLYDLDLEEMILVRQVTENIASFKVVFEIVKGRE